MTNGKLDNEGGKAANDNEGGKAANAPVQAIISRTTASCLLSSLGHVLLRILNNSIRKHKTIFS